MKTRILVSNDDGEEFDFTGEDLSFGIDGNQMLFITEPPNKHSHDVAQPQLRRTVAVFRTFKHVELVDVD